MGKYINEMIHRDHLDALAQEYYERTKGMNEADTSRVMTELIAKCGGDYKGFRQARKNYRDNVPKEKATSSGGLTAIGAGWGRETTGIRYTD